MTNYGKIRKQCGRGKYASGGRVAASRTGGKTVINIMTPPPASGMPAAPALPAPSPSSPGAATAGPVPPQAAAMALNAMQDKPQAPGFKRGGRIKGGAESGVGRLQQARHYKAKRGKP